METWSIILAGAGITAAVLFILYAKIHVRDQWLKLDKMLCVSAAELKSGNYCIEETLDAKIYQRLLDLYKDLDLEYKQADMEKEMVKAYIADLSHQMKTPLANLTLYNDLMLEEELTPIEADSFKQKIHEELVKMQWLLSSLTKITRLELGAIQFEVNEASWQQAVDLAQESVRGQMMQKGINMTVKGDFNKTVIMNPKWLAEALVNILENAGKYSEDGSAIRIEAEELELYQRLNIIDTGIGIEKEDYNNIFKRFYRGKNAADLPGSGLGLYLAQLILNKQDGYITVKSEIGQGTCFSIYLKRQF